MPIPEGLGFVQMNVTTEMAFGARIALFLSSLTLNPGLICSMRRHRVTKLTE